MARVGEGFQGFEAWALGTVEASGYKNTRPCAGPQRCACTLDTDGVHLGSARARVHLGSGARVEFPDIERFEEIDDRAISANVYAIDPNGTNNIVVNRITKI